MLSFYSGVMGDDINALVVAAQRRALAEVAGRATATGIVCPREHGGRDGPEPTRYGDWERGGIAHDF